MERADVTELLAGTEVWDLTLPWVPMYWDLETLAAYRDAGWTFVSASLTDSSGSSTRRSGSPSARPSTRSTAGGATGSSWSA
jgi:hypothetical protein